MREVEQRLVRIARRWEDELKQALLESAGEERGNALFERYAGGFAAGYREEHSPRVAVHDIEQMETLVEPGRAGDEPVRAARSAARAGCASSCSAPGSSRRCRRACRCSSTWACRCSRSGPTKCERADGARQVVDRRLRHERAGAATRSTSRACAAASRRRFLRTWRGQNENDDFNRLVLLAGLDWREVTVLRAYARYMKQAAFTFSQAYIEQALAAHPAIAADLVALFRARFDPAAGDDRAAREAQIAARIDGRARRRSPTSTRTASCASTWR